MVIGDSTASLFYDYAQLREQYTSVSKEEPALESTELEESDEKGESRLDGDLQLTNREQREIEQLRRKDRSTKAHEMAHLVTGGQLSSSAPTYEYELGPDGKRYAVGGEVKMDAKRVPGDPEETIRKMQKIRRAAMAPANPSNQDRKSAVVAAQIASAARMEIQDRARLEAKQEEAVRNGEESIGEHLVFKSSSTVAEMFFGSSSAFPFSRKINMLI